MIDYKESKFPLESLVGGWYMPEKICDDIIDYFHQKKDLHIPGGIGLEDDFRVDLDIKESTDLVIDKEFADEPFRTYRNYLNDIVLKYQDRYDDLKHHHKWNIIENYNIQYYKPGGGFKKWHSENQANENRLMVFMTYLNNVKDGGTDFKYQSLRIEAKKGLTLIWPATYTHCHRGVVNYEQDKYIVTGWYGFE